jgi:hypothetical protein
MLLRALAEIETVQLSMKLFERDVVAGVDFRSTFSERATFGR